MRFLLINQTFHPDVASSGQHLTDLAVSLAERGHQVTVVTSRRAYDNPGKVFSADETWNRIRIFRVSATGFGKRARWRRAADFASFLGACCWRLFRLPEQDVILAMTSPPLVSFLGAWFGRLRGGRFCYWIMDLNPDEALAAGWLSPNSLAARWLERCSRFSLRHAAKIIVLDHFMRQRILDKGMDAGRIFVLPPWSHDAEVRPDAEGRAEFRKRLGLDGKFVVMYSGNHSPCHPLDTVLKAATRLAENRDIVFLFVGGGSQFAAVQKFAADHAFSNIVCLPYQPLDQLAASLSAGDLHLVVMGDPFVGIVHPCKIYNILRVGAPVLYIGPQPSHVSEILAALDGEFPCAWANHGEVDRVVKHILAARQKQVASNAVHSDRRGERTREPTPPGRVQSDLAQTAPLESKFSKAALLPQLVDLLERDESLK